ncbi:UNVERIFIED_CONTAM: hypothetical protein PYX00_000053 [Menopon gallinae]
MRLTKPTIGSPIIVTNEPKDLLEDILNSELKNDIASVSGTETIAAGQFLITPQSFGQIYLGESFLSYILVYNDSLQIAKDVSVKADLQSASKRIELSGNQVADLLPEHTIDQIIHHEVTEIGTHILVCEVSYVTPAGTPLSFRKFFKFQVLQPLDIKTKFYNAESDEVFLEAQVQNITGGPIHLEKVALEPSYLFKVSSLNSPEEKRPGGGLLLPQASRQYLYCLSPISDPSTGSGLGATDIGRLDIVWRSNLGEKGRLQTSPLRRMAPDYGDIRLSVHHLPNIVKIEEPFTLKCKISNLSVRSMDLTLNLEKIYPGLIWIGTSGRRIGTLPVGESTFLELTLVPLTAGLHNISGIRLNDALLGKSYTYDDLAQVFVT